MANLLQFDEKNDIQKREQSMSMLTRLREFNWQTSGKKPTHLRRRFCFPCFQYGAKNQIHLTNSCKNHQKAELLLYEKLRIISYEFHMILLEFSCDFFRGTLGLSQIIFDFCRLSLFCFLTVK